MVNICIIDDSRPILYSLPDAFPPDTPAVRAAAAATPFCQPIDSKRCSRPISMIGPRTSDRSQWRALRISGANESSRCQLSAFLDRDKGVVVVTNADAGGQLVQEVILTTAREYGPTVSNQPSTVA